MLASIQLELYKKKYKLLEKIGMEIFFSSWSLDKGEEVSADVVWWTLIEGERHLCKKKKPPELEGRSVRHDWSWGGKSLGKKSAENLSHPPAPKLQL